MQIKLAAGYIIKTVDLAHFPSAWFAHVSEYTALTHRFEIKSNDSTTFHNISFSKLKHSKESTESVINISLFLVSIFATENYNGNPIPASKNIQRSLIIIKRKTSYVRQ